MIEAALRIGVEAPGNDGQSGVLRRLRESPALKDDLSPALIDRLARIESALWQTDNEPAAGAGYSLDINMDGRIDVTDARLLLWNWSRPKLRVELAEQMRGIPENAGVYFGEIVRQSPRKISPEPNP